MSSGYLDQNGATGSAARSNNSGTFRDDQYSLWQGVELTLESH